MSIWATGPCYYRLWSTPGRGKCASVHPPLRPPGQQQAEVAAREQAERERVEALERAEWAERENAARRAWQQREIEEAEEAELVERISLRDERERVQLAAQEAQDLERALTASLAAACASPPASAPAASSTSEVAVSADSVNDAQCNICLEGTEDGNYHALVQPCNTCNIFMHLGCAATWRIRCRNGQVTGRPSAPTCPGCRSPF